MLLSCQASWAKWSSVCSQTLIIIFLVKSISDNYIRSSHQRCSVKEGFVKHFANFTGNVKFETFLRTSLLQNITGGLPLLHALFQKKHLEKVHLLRSSQKTVRTSICVLLWSSYNSNNSKNHMCVMRPLEVGKIKPPQIKNTPAAVPVVADHFK